MWGTKPDEDLIGLTYERDQNVVGWHRHKVADGDAIVESVSVLPRENEEDELWAVVKITIDSLVKRYIVRMNDREWGTSLATEWAGSDLYKVYSSPESNDLAGLDYLEGKTVSVVADGVPLTDETVSDGKITVDTGTYSRIVVGLSFTATLAPIYLELDQYIQGNRKGCHRGSIHFKNTYSAKIGSISTDLYNVKFDPDATAPYDGVREVNFSDYAEYLKTCYIVQEEQMPIEVLAMVPIMEGGRG